MVLKGEEGVRRDFSGVLIAEGRKEHDIMEYGGKT